MHICHLRRVHCLLIILAVKIAAGAGLQDDIIEKHQQHMPCSQHGFGHLLPALPSAFFAQW